MEHKKSDYYETLGLTRDADGADIKAAYRKLAMKYHPDRNPNDPKAEDKFMQISSAYDVLKDPGKRAAYDRGGSQAAADTSRQSGHPRQDPIRDFMQESGGNQRGKSPVDDFLARVFGEEFGRPPQPDLTKPYIFEVNLKAGKIPVRKIEDILSKNPSLFRDGTAYDILKLARGDWLPAIPS